MKENPEVLQSLHQYERAIDEAGVPFYMDAEAMLDVVDYYLKESRFTDAEICLRYAERLHPEDENVQIMRAFRLKDEGKWSEAMRIVRNLRDQEAHDVQLLYFEEKLSSFDLEAAEKHLHEIMRDGNAHSNYDWHIDIAEIYMDYGHFSRAIAWLKQIPEEYADFLRAQELLAECAEKTGDNKQAVHILQNLIDRNPYDEALWRELAEVQEFGERYREAAESLQYALAINPENAQTLRQNASLHAMAYPELPLSQGITQYILSHGDDYTLSLSFAEALLPDALQDKSPDLHGKAIRALRNALGSCPRYAGERQIIVTTLAAYLMTGGNQKQAYELLDTAAVDLGIVREELYLNVAELLKRNGSKS